jgi:hypothetical protein
VRNPETPGLEGIVTTYLQVVPCYWRDYSSEAAVIAAWNADKDFRINDVTSRWDGKPINRPQHPPGTTIEVRYNDGRKVVMIEYPGPPAPCGHTGYGCTADLCGWF